MTLPMLGRAWVRVAERDATTNVSLESLAQELGVRRQSVWHHVRREPGAFETAVGEALVERLTVPPPKRGPWRREALRLLRSVRDQLVAMPRLAPWTGFALTYGTAWSRHVDGLAVILRRSGAHTDRVYATAHAALHLARSFGVENPAEKRLKGSDLAAASIAMLHGLYARPSMLASGETFDHVCGALLDALGGQARVTKKAAAPARRRGTPGR